MGNSTVKLYYDCKILNDRNMIVDDVDSYLSTLTPTVMEDFQFIKHDLSISIKIDTEEIGANVNSGNILNPFAAGKLNYVSIQNETDYSPIYYFVIDQEWTAVRTIKLYLALDTLNTFKYNVAYSFDKKTLVLREHKDRYFKIPYISGSKSYLRKIDFESEGISPLQYQVSDQEIIDEKANFDWYLLYMADNTKSSVTGETLPINAFIMAEEPITTALINYGLKISDLNQSKVYWFGKNVPNSFTSGNVEIDGTKYAITEAMFVMYSAAVGWFFSKATGNAGSTKIRNLDSTSILIFDESKEIDVTEQSSLPTILSGDLSSIGGRISAAKTAVVAPSQQAGEQGIDDVFTIDRTDTRISKILKLPYCPFNVQISGGNINIPSELERTAVKWENEKTYNYLKIKTNFLQAFQNNISNDNTFYQRIFKYSDFSEDVRKDLEESKLFHSDFQNFRFIYDSFQYIFAAEKITETKVRDGVKKLEFPFKFITTSTMNSRFLFDFGDFIEYESNKFIESYPYILTIARNNEIPIFNSEYINYIRNGYNYDVKARNASIVSASLGIVSNAAQVALTPLTVGKSIKNVATAAAGLEAVKAGVTSQKYKSALAAVEESKKGVATASQIAISNAFGAVSGIINGINSIRQTETAFEQKQKSMRMANVSVESSDDIDLLTYYSNNRAHMPHYCCSERMYKALSDLFYYQGYINNEQKIPDVNSRKWFNFLKCEALLINNKNIDDKYLENIKERFEIGVTFYHKNNNTWDFAQETANREIWMNV